jgi:4-azaleucine resistance transporter AzlC
LSRRSHSMRAGAKDIAPILVGIVPFGLVAGAAVIQAGFGLAEAVGMSVFVNAGASQIVATTLFGSGAPLWLALTTALIVNARMFIYSTSIAPVLSEAPGWERPLLGHMLVDQNYASTMTKGRFREDVDVIPYYVGAWFALAGVWQLSTIAGALIGPLIPPSWGLEFAVPLVFLAMLAPTLKDSTAVSVCMVTAVASAVLVPLLPLQTGLVVAILVGMLYGAWRDRPAAEPGAS